jgi:hypothetical protein
MALQLREHMRAQTRATLHDPRHGQTGVVIQDRPRHTAEKPERRHMPVAEGFRRLRRIRLHKAAVRMWQVHAKIMEPHLLAANVAIRLAKIRLRMAGTVVQRHKHLARA